MSCYTDLYIVPLQEIKDNVPYTSMTKKHISYVGNHISDITDILTCHAAVIRNDNPIWYNSIYILNKEGLTEAIQDISRMIAEEYHLRLTNEELKDYWVSDMMEHMERWNDMSYLNLDPDEPDVSNTEYKVFDLVRVLKSVDWETERVIVAR